MYTKVLLQCTQRSFQVKVAKGDYFDCGNDRIGRSLKWLKRDEIEVSKAKKVRETKNKIELQKTEEAGCPVTLMKIIPAIRESK